MDDYVFNKSIFYFIQRFQRYTTLIVKELLYNKKSNFYFYFKKCCNLHKYNQPNNIIKQYYGIIKTFKVLFIVKKKQFGRINITLNKQAFFDFKNIFMISICQDGKLVKRWDIITI